MMQRFRVGYMMNASNANRAAVKVREKWWIGVVDELTSVPGSDSERRHEYQRVDILMKG